MLILLSFALILNQACYQTINTNGEAVPYSTIKKKNKNEGMFSDQNGSFCFENLKKGDTLEFSAIGYKNTERSFEDLQNNRLIVLPVEIRQLTGIIINKRKFKTARLGKFKKVALATYGYGPNSLLPLAEFIENKNSIKNGIIKSLKLSVESREDNYKLRFRFFKNSKNNLPDDVDIILDNVTIDTGFKSKYVELDLEKYRIPFEGEGLWVSVESLGKYDKNNTFIPNSFGELGKVKYRSNNPSKVKSINHLAPIFNYIKSSSKYSPYTKTWYNKWSNKMIKSFINCEMMLDLEIIY